MEVPGLGPPLVLPAALLLDLESTRGDDEEDDTLLYFYPETESMEALSKSLKGMLLAIRGVTNSIAGQRVRLVTMDHLDSDQKVIVAYMHLGGALLALLLPSKVPEFLAKALAGDASQLLQFALGPPDNWWGPDEGESVGGTAEAEVEAGSFSAPGNTWVGRTATRKGESKIIGTWLRIRLDMILQSYFMEIRSREWLHAHIVPAFELGVPYAAVPPEMQLRALELLNNVEVATPPAEQRLATPPRFALSTSSCLIHNGRLISSHMTIRETKEVWRMCWALSLYQRTEEHPPIVLLQDAYLSADAAAAHVPQGSAPEGRTSLPGSPSGPSRTSSITGSEQQPGGRRVVLLLVGIGLDIIAVMLTPIGDSASTDLKGSFLVDAAMHDLARFQDAESRNIQKLLGAAEEGNAASGGSRPGTPGTPGSPSRPQSSPSISRQGSWAAAAGPTECVLLHHLSHNGVNGVLLSTEPPPGELASNLAGDFVATAFHLHSVFDRLRHATWGVANRGSDHRGGPGRSGSGDHDSPPGPSSPFTPYSPFSNSPGPQWEPTTPLSAGRSLVASSESHAPAPTLSSLISAAGNLRDGPAQRLGKADAAVFAAHKELERLQGLFEVRIGLMRTDLVPLPRSAAAPHDPKWWVTGRVDSSGRELFICHHEDVSLSSVDMAFQISFGSFG